MSVCVNVIFVPYRSGDGVDRPQTQIIFRYLKSASIGCKTTLVMQSLKYTVAAPVLHWLIESDEFANSQNITQRYKKLHSSCYIVSLTTQMFS